MIGLATFLLLLAPQATAPAPGPGPQSPLFGGIPTGTATPGPLPLSLADAIDRGLRGNLALILAEQGVRSARGSRLEAFGDVLPHLSGRLSAVRQKLSLEAFGFSGFPGIDSPVVGPFNVFDSRVLLTEELDLKRLYKARAEGQRVEAARWTYQDTRELVVLVSGNLYLRTLAEQSRVEAARAEAETARALHQLALDRKSAGVVPGVDVLRAEVELRSREQRVIEADTRLARAKLDLARAIGLPLGQEIQLTDAMPSPVVPPLTLEQTMEMAFARRSDWKAAQARVRAAEASRRSALGEALPGLTLDADYGAIGQTYGGARNTFTLAGALRVPLFQGGLVAGKVLAADAALQSARAGVEDLRGRIDYDVRVAGLELKAAADRQAVAESARALAREQLRQAQDRFAAGVANNVDVVLAQEAVARAEEDWISTVYDFNLARATLGRAVGLVEDAFRQLVRGQ
ncbi:MAG TPA: TolC family protein [Vicinamibacteria bacterium]|nr:TolC family protein [Vicinamibacteria bacterium]